MTQVKLSLPDIANQINLALQSYSDKDWNYSRITLETRALENISCPYAIWVDTIDTSKTQGRGELRTYSTEVSWGVRHSSELSILEIISLRLNRALLESTTDEHWKFVRPVIRVAKKEELLKQGITEALWYQVTEVDGDDFDTR